MPAILSSALLILSIVARWKIFEDNQEEGWKALIPFYSSYIFSKTFNEERLGKKLAWAEAVFMMASIPFGILLFFATIMATTLVLAGGLGFISEVSFWKQLFDSMFFSGHKLFIILLLIVSISFIVLEYLHIKLHYRYTLFQNSSVWFMILWVLIPSIGYLYFAFRQEQTDIL